MEVILNAFPETSVDVHHPDVLVHVEIRKVVNIYSLMIRDRAVCRWATNGKATPAFVRRYRQPGGRLYDRKARGEDRCSLLPCSAIHRPRKAEGGRPGQAGSTLFGSIPLHVVNFTDIQLYIYEQCPYEELTTYHAPLLMKIAEEIAKKSDSLALITGESIGQVASQTVQSLAATNEVCTMPVFRPLIGFDKQEIIDILRKSEPLKPPFSRSRTAVPSLWPSIR